MQTEKEKECLAVYEKTVLEAVGETRNALTAGAQEHERKLSLQAGCKSAEDALNLADNNYRSGIAEYSDVLDAQRTLFDSQRQVLDQLMASHTARAEIDRLLGTSAQAFANNGI